MLAARGYTSNVPPGGYEHTRPTCEFSRPLPSVAANAVVELHRRGEVLHITSQNLVEFRNAATRPIAANGLGLSPAEAKAKSDGFEATFPLLSETPAIHGA